MYILFPQFPSDSSSKAAQKEAESSQKLIGLLAVLASSLSSGFAGVFYEKLLKESAQPSVIIRNIQLGNIRLSHSNYLKKQKVVELFSVFFQDSFPQFLVLLVFLLMIGRKLLNAVFSTVIHQSSGLSLCSKYQDIFYILFFQSNKMFVLGLWRTCSCSCD